ncbi:MAG: TetR family transcriptional regulator [Candidatus Hydrogenedentes bacterium]|nr:TetR family transcriptional regulator [Candidatus Hydrogenedentota bacterium]
METTTESRAGEQRWGVGVQGAGEQFALKRLAILSTAARLFNEKSYHLTSLDQLARELNVTKPSLYHYVESKDDILLQILSEGMQQIDPAIDGAIRDGRTGLEKLHLFVCNYVPVMTSEFGKCLVMSGLEPLQPASREKLLPAYRRIDRGVRTMITEGIQDGSIGPCDPRMVAFTIFGALHAIPAWYRSDGELTPEEIAEMQWTVFACGLKPSRAATGGPVSGTAGARARSAA